MTGQLSSAVDQDWFGFSMSNAGTVGVTFDSPENLSGAAFGYHTVEVRDSTGTLLARIDTGSDTAFQTGLSASGSYYLVVRDGPYSVLSTGQYGVTITTGFPQPTVESEPNDNSGEADALTPGQKTFGQLLSQSDQDWFSLTTSGSATIGVTFDSPENVAGAAFGYHTIQVRNAAGTVFASLDTGEDKTFQAGVPSAGTYFVVVRDGPYSILSTKQYGITATTTAPVPPVPISVQIYPSVEIAWNSIAGSSYVIEWTANLATPAWFPLSPTLAGTGGEMTHLDSTRGKMQGFYRINETSSTAARADSRVLQRIGAAVIPGAAAQRPASPRSPGATLRTR